MAKGVWLVFALLALATGTVFASPNVVVLPAPESADAPPAWYPAEAKNPLPSALPADAPLLATAYHFKTDVFRAVDGRPSAVGYIRRGTILPIVREENGRGCKGGDWYITPSGDYVCTGLGVRVAESAQEMRLHYRLPNIQHALPYLYVNVKDREALRFYREPTPEEEAALRRGKVDLEVVDRKMDGYFVLALADNPDVVPGSYVKTVTGRVVKKADIERFPPSKMHGERISPRNPLPIAFVYQDAQQVGQISDKAFRVIGRAEKHARFFAARRFALKNKEYVVNRNGRAMSRDAVRIAQTIPRPSTIPAGEKWIHVNLSEQTLVAYEGERPVFATLISGGKKGYEPPRGTFRTFNKHVTTTMNGPDAVDGWYEVEEVPWTMYYYKGYALHGAYWHNDFGTARSHGCTNIAPPDARWLFYWSLPKLPRRWHGIHAAGTWVYVS